MVNHKIGWPKEIGNQVFLAGQCPICKKRFSKGQLVDYVKTEQGLHYIHSDCFEKELSHHG